MRHIDVEHRTCGDCGGNGTFVPDNRDCRRCQRSGELTVCLGCGDEMPLPETKLHGGYCAGCREQLDIAEALENAS